LKDSFHADGHSEDDEKKNYWDEDQKKQALATKEKAEKSGQRKTG
jgi:hypothetical protein